MENLSISDAPPQGPGPVLGAGPGRVPPHTQAQLPAQMFTTAAQLLDLTDTNLVLQSTVERLFVPPSPSTGERGLYADISRGLFLVRGENVLLLGEIDLDKDDDPPAGYDKAELQVVESLLKARKAEDKAKEKSRLKKLASLGFEGEHSGEIIF
ncbi:hypothetical protein OOU_Y34scaffold00765g3 [Pyricularia oryzae Y34]|uniref:LSM domain-containing protein n=2 Tax=Pyricularia oryzae TaxID=318829 RepID=A0AA97PH76_PYRO3|nr:hypothetical protein OOU_Y34scaffold00765g3 [Pyricularia oryzae Y34]